MTLNELNSFFTSLIDNITTDDNNISRTGLLNYVLPALNMSRLTDSEEVSYSYFKREKENIEIDAYQINETGERLQLFLSNLILPNMGDIQIARKDYYEAFFSKAKNFFTNAVKNYLMDVQSGDPAAVLIKSLETGDFQNQIDVVEIFLISNTISIETRGSQSPKTFTFADENLNVSYTFRNERKSKSFKIKYQLIDLNKIYNYELAEGNSEPIIINFSPALTAIKAADDAGLFESYLAVIPAKLLVGFYHDYSSRLLERNVRSFLQFKGVNQRLRETLAKEPEKFIAYNNGLTITATDSEIEQSGGVALIKSLTDFQIVNGGQTTASIYFTSKDGIDISKVNVTVKINVVKSDDRESLNNLISKISQYSNSQNKVSSVDLNSRSVHLIKIKKLSESITDPSGSKWFFERIRGEFNTMLRIHSNQKAQIEKNYPKSKRLSKEQIAKYYVAWGTTPYLVRKGGEKVFRDFMDFIQLDHNEKPMSPENIGRAFYEDLIAKAILFKEFETIYGIGPNAIGQIRSSVVPYALSLLYKLTLKRKRNTFDLGAIWVAQGLPEDLKDFAKKLLLLMHEWLKSYSKSDDVGEYAKKEELWSAVASSPEVQAFENDTDVQSVIARYELSDASYRKRYSPSDVFDFSLINEICRIYSNGVKFYTSFKLRFMDKLTSNEVRKLEGLVQKLQVRHNLAKDQVDFENELIKKIQTTNPEWFSDSKPVSSNLVDVIGKVASIYNKNNSRIKEAFEAEGIKRINKGEPEGNARSWQNVGIALSKNQDPQISDLLKLTV